MTKIIDMVNGPRYTFPVNEKKYFWKKGSTKRIGTTAKRRFTYNQPSFQKTVPVNKKVRYCINRMTIKPPEVARVCKNIEGTPISFLNLIDPFIRKELDRKNKKKNGK